MQKYTEVLTTTHSKPNLNNPFLVIIWKDACI